MIGRTVRHYEIREQLGSGGMGVVYKAYDTELRRFVALKFLPPATARDPRATARLRNEAIAASSLGSDHVQAVHEIAEDDEGRLFIVLEFYEGETLGDRIARGPLPAAEAVAVVRQVAQGLSAAHDASLVHRDIKPANIFLTRDGAVKILDFGLARAVDRERQTMTGAALGTPAYLAPEQARGDAVDRRADVWSLGVTLYECLTGKRPFRGDYGQAVIYNILNEDPEPVTDLAPAAGRVLAAVLDRALAKDPARRFQDCRELIDALDGASARAGLRRRRAARLGFGALAAAAAALVLWLVPGTVRNGASPVGPPSLAVLLFDNLGPEGDDGYVAASITEDLITGLAQFEGLNVLSRSAVERYRGRKPEPGVVGRNLGVGYVLEGSFRRVPDGMRISVQLIDAGSAFTIWADSFDGPFTDIFAIEDTVAVSVARALDLPTGGPAYALVTRHWTRNVEAYSYYLVGREKYWERGNPDRFYEARKLFAKALEIDPLYAPALAGLSQCHTAAIGFGIAEPDALEKALALARRAKEIDPALAVAWRAEGFALEESRRGEEAIACYRRALALSPGLETVYNLLGRVTFGWGEGVRQCYDVFERGIAARPYEDLNYVEFAQVLLKQGKVAEAEAVLARGLERLPNGPGLRYVQGVAWCMAGQVARGADMWLGRVAEQPDDFRPYSRLVLTLPYYDRQATADSVAVLMRRHWPDSPLIVRIDADYESGRGHYDAADSLYRRALAADPDMYIAQAGLADCLLARGRGDEARAVVADLLARWPGLPDTYALACRFHVKVDDWARVRDIAARWVEAFPGDAEAHDCLGEALRTLGSPERALESHRRGLATDWALFDNYRGFCLAARTLDVPADEQLAVAGKAVEVWPGKPFSWFLSGEVNERLGRTYQAAGAYQKAYDLDPHWGRGQALRALAAVYGRDGHHHQEVEAYLDVVARYPDETKTWILLAERAYHILGDEDLARRAATRALELDDVDATVTCYAHTVAHRILGDLDRGRDPDSAAGHYAAAVRTAERGLEDLAGAARCAALHGALGRTYARQGRADKARAQASLAVAGNPGDLGNLVAAAQIYSSLEDTDLAFTVLDSALAYGYRDRTELEHDPDLLAVRRDPRFTGLLRRID